MVDIACRSVAANGVRLHIAEAGPSDGPCIILCHGFPESWYSWRHQLRALGEAGYHVVAPDMHFVQLVPPGRGLRLHAPKLVGDMVGLLAALPHKTAIIAGHDYGALRSRGTLPSSFGRTSSRRSLGCGPVPYYGARTTFTYDHTIPPSESMRREVGPNGFHYQLYFGQIGRAERDIEKDVRGWLGGSSTHFRPMRRPGRSNSRSLPTPSSA